MRKSEVIEHLIGTDKAFGIAVLLRAEAEVARVHCNLFPASWFPLFQRQASVGDVVEVRLAAPLNRTERYVIATADQNGFAAGYCTEAQWKSRPKVSSGGQPRPIRR